MKILFLHGLESKPGGSKVQYLKGLGHEVLNPALPSNDFEASVRIAQVACDEDSPDVIVGSSRGGAIAMAMNRRNIKTILIAPAYKHYDIVPTHATVRGDEILLHSIRDTIVPLEDSVKLVSEHDCQLHVCGACHRMSDEDALKALGDLL